MSGEWLYEANERVIYVISIVIFLGCVGVGYRVGYRVHTEEKELALSMISALQGAALGMLALLIGFTFALAINLFEQRKALVLDEANAIGTADLRARLLPEPYSAEARRLLRTYLGARLSLHRDSDDQDRLDRAIKDSLKLQEDLWEQAAAASALRPLSVPTGPFVQALNEMIDLHEKNLTALRNHVPAATILLLYFVAFVGLGLTGYDCGLCEVRHRLPNTIISVLIASVILVVIDFERPRHGLITVGVQPLVDLQTSMIPAH